MRLRSSGIINLQPPAREVCGFAQVFRTEAGPESSRLAAG
jgi:hypothetical protein